MVLLILIVLAVCVGEGLCQRVLPDDYEFECQPKEGKGWLGIFEDWAPLNVNDYEELLKYDSIRRLAEASKGWLTDLKVLRKTEEYKRMASYVCSKAYLHLDFYLDNAVAFFEYLLKEFEVNKPPRIDDEDILEDYTTFLDWVNDEKRIETMKSIEEHHELHDKSVKESTQATESEEFVSLSESVMNLDEWKNIEQAINETGIPWYYVLPLIQYYAETFWEKH